MKVKDKCFAIETHHDSIYFKMVRKRERERRESFVLLYSTCMYMYCMLFVSLYMYSTCMLLSVVCIYRPIHQQLSMC